MTEKDIQCFALLGAQRALLGVITPGIRAVSLQWDGFKLLQFRVHYEKQPSEEEMEGMEVVVAEILADIPFHRADPVETIVTAEPVSELKFLDRLIYLRKESWPTTS